MLMTVAEFRNRVDKALPLLIRDLQDQTGRRNPEEEAAWAASFPAVSHALSTAELQPLHLYFGERGHLSLEYRLPASASWCDMVLLGAHRRRPSAVVVELKDWQTRADQPGPIEGLIQRHGAIMLHPSEQVRGYVEYCRRFHSAVRSGAADVHGCVLFTRDRHFGSYSVTPNDRLASDFPCFAATPSIIDPSLITFFRERLSEPNEVFAKEFERGEYRQDRSFVRQIGAQILTPNGSPFELLDNQRLGLALCRAEIEKAVFRVEGRPKKTVILISGPPGSGKSVLAAKIWANLVTDSRIENGDFVLTTTSKAQESNWRHLIQQVAGHGARGVILPANQYAPLTIPGLGKLQKTHHRHFADAMKWRDSLKTLRSLHGKLRMPDDHLLVSVVDEAHALINPEHSDARTQSGWPNTLGPQAYHIIRSSVVSIFLLDEVQSFRERESTTIEEIRQWAKELGADVPPLISLEGAQFRCAGSKEYVEWVEALLAGVDSASCAARTPGWLHAPPQSERSTALKAAEHAEPYKVGLLPNHKRRSSFRFQLVESPIEVEASLREACKGGDTARIVASYSREWRTKGASDPHRLPADMQDFCFSIRNRGSHQIWCRPWNYVPQGDDYAAFVQAAAGSPMANDPLCEVGCPYVVRGFDFDYVGILWLSDLVWRSGKWVVRPENVHETGLKRMLARARKEERLDGPANVALLRKVQQAYRILLTRALKGVFVWCEDAETRDRLEAALRLNAAALS